MNILERLLEYTLLLDSSVKTGSLGWWGAESGLF